VLVLSNASPTFSTQAMSPSSETELIGETWTLERASEISGNVTAETKLEISNFIEFLNHGFAESVGRKLKLVEVSVNDKTEDPSKQEGRVVCEITVTEDMLNPTGILHGGATAYLIDICTSLPILALECHSGGGSGITISQSINIMYHGPALLGDKLRIVNTSMAMGARVLTARCEMWNATRHRLVATGTHAKMAPSTSKL